jgi:hypothetical protein
MMKNLSLWVCGGLAVFAVLSGGGGMCLSLLQMSCAETNDIIAGSAGFIAGAVLVSAGIIALALLSLTTALTARSEPPPAPEDEP